MRVGARRRSSPWSSRSGQADAVVLADRARGLGDGVDAGAGVERTRDVDPVVAGEGLEDLGVPRKVLLWKSRHAATRIWQGHAELYVVADGERATEPPVLHESTLGGIDDHVHAEPADVETALWFEVAKLVQGRSGEDAERVEVEERVFGDGGGEPPLVKERRAELRFDDLVAVSFGIVVLQVRVVLIDRVAVLRGARQLHVAPEEARQDGVDIRRVAQDRVPVGELDPHRWKLVAWPRRFDERRPAVEQVGPPLRVLSARHLARFPVPDRIRAIADDPALSQVGRVELLTQNRLDGESPQRPDRANRLARGHFSTLLNSAALCALVAELPAPEPFERLG